MMAAIKFILQNPTIRSSEIFRLDIDAHTTGIPLTFNDTGEAVADIPANEPWVFAYGVNGAEGTVVRIAIQNSDGKNLVRERKRTIKKVALTDAVQFVVPL